MAQHSYLVQAFRAQRQDVGLRFGGLNINININTNMNNRYICLHICIFNHLYICISVSVWGSMRCGVGGFGIEGLERRASG